MRNIKEIIIHCSATFPRQDITATDIDRWHRLRGWKMIGYHYVVRLDGTVENGRPESVNGAHCKGHNGQSIGVCYVGGLDAEGRPADTRTEAQKEALLRLLGSLKRRYPQARIFGHNKVSNKACPCFDAEDEYNTIE